MSQNEVTATAMFEAERTYRVLEDQLFNRLFEIMELPDITQHPWPFSNWWHDDYDSSFELGGVQADYRIKPEWLPRIWDLGFCRLWLNHTDGSETYYWRGGWPDGSRKEGGNPRDCGGDARNVKRLIASRDRILADLNQARAKLKLSEDRP